MQNEKTNETSTKPKEPKKCSAKCNAKSTSSLVLKKGQVMATVSQNLADNFIPDLSPSDEEEVSEMSECHEVIDKTIDKALLQQSFHQWVESFILDQEELDDGDASRFLLSHDSIEGAEVRTVDPETQAKLEALLEAAGIGKLSTPDGKAYADPEVLRRLTSSVSCALDEAAAALTRMRAEQTEGATADRSLAKACSNGDIGTVRQLLDEGGSVNETTEEGESLLSLACSAGYYELAQVLLAMRANVEDRGIKGDCTPLMEAASGGYVDIVKLLIVNGADVNAQSSAGNTPLHYAACGGHEDVVRALIESSANVEEHNENGHTPLMEASSAGHVGVAKILLEAGAGINTHSNEFKESALTLACYKGHLEMVKFLLEAGADQEHKTDEMHTALMEASMDGHVEVARLLLDHGAQVNMPADSFESPLTLAACGGHVDLANLLIERGANLEEVNDEGYTPLMEAAREGHEEMVVLLLAHGAYINAQTEETQETALTLACCGGFLDVAKFLIKAGADLELGCSTPLMEAAQEGHLELVKYLIQAGANVHAQTQTGDTALTYACENGHTEVAEVLLDEKCDIEHESEGGRTPLMKAARAGHYKTVQFLISRGADINKHTSTNDHTALSLASAGGHRAVVDLLLKHGSNPNHRLKDGSTMLIEAAKGGHTTVVNLLLDWPNNIQSSSPDLVQHSPPQSKVDISDMPRVPIHGLTNIVPPQDPDQIPASTNNLSAMAHATAVSETSGQVNLKDFNIQTKSVEPTRPAMQKLPTNNKLDTKATIAITTTTTTTTACTQVSATGENISAKSAGTTITSTSCVTTALNNNDPKKSSGNIKSNVMNEASVVESCLSGSSSQASETGSDYGMEGEQSQPEAGVTSSSSSSLIPFDSEDKMNEMMKASERLEAFISKMMRRAEQLHTTSEEQSLQKQQILEELQKVEQELQEKAKNPLLLLNAQSKQDVVIDNSKMALLQEELSFDEEEEDCHQSLGMTLPVVICEAGSYDLVGETRVRPSLDLTLGQVNDEDHLKASTKLASDQAVILENNSGTVPSAGTEVKTAQLAKQESLSSSSNASSSSSADSGCGNSDFNGVCLEGTEVDGPPLAAKSGSNKKQDQDDSPAVESKTSPQSSQPSPTSKLTPEVDGKNKKKTAASHSESPDAVKTSNKSSETENGEESGSRASSEEVDLTNVIPLMNARDDNQMEKPLQVLQNQELLQQHVQEQIKAGTDPTKIALSIQQQLKIQHQQILQQQHLTQLAQQCGQSCPLQLDSLVPQSVQIAAKSASSPPANGTKSSCRELQLEHQRQQLQAQLELEQAKTKTLQAQLQLQKQIKTNNPQTAAKYQQQLNVQQQTTVTCQTQLATPDLQQLKLQQIRQQLQLQSQQLPANQQLSQQELIQQQQQLQRTQQLQHLHQPHLQQQQQQQQQASVAVTSPSQAGDQTSQVSTTQTTTATQLLSQQEVLQQLHKVQHLQQMQQLAQQKHMGQYQGNTWPVTTTAVTTATAASIGNGQKKGKKKHQLLPPQQLQQQQLLPQQMLANNQLNMQFADYTTASTNTMATCTSSSYDYLQLISPSSSTPVTPNPSPASPQISPPMYPAVDLDAETESNHDTALTLACAGGHAELVSLLLSRGSDIEHRDKKGFTPLILAATAGHAEVVEILLNHGAEIEAQSERTKDTPLSLACSGGRYEVVKLLLTRGANKEHRNVSDYTPLSLAASGGYVDIIELLLHHGAEINSRTGSKLGISPLMLAAMNGHTHAVKQLLDMGSDINAQIETNKNTALTLACFQGRNEVVSLLVDRRANIEHRAKTGLTPLMEAASGGYVEVGRVLLNKGADVNAPPVPSSRDTALTIAADKGHYRFVDLLLSRKAAIDVKNKKGNSPLWLACNGGHLDVVQLLVQAGADVDSQDNRKVSCLMAAFRKGHVKVIKWLVKYVTQFPSDQECLRYISTVTDQDLLKKCHQCMEIIVSAKARQAAEANRNASILLEEIDAERSREESKKAAAARKREKKRKKKKEKQEREREQEKKDQKGKVQANGHSKSSSPEPANKEAEEEDEEDDDDEEEVSKKQTEGKSKKKNVNDNSTNAAQLSKEGRTSAGNAISSNVSNKNKKNQALANEGVLSGNQSQAQDKSNRSAGANKTQPQAKNQQSETSTNNELNSTNKTMTSNSQASGRGKSKRKQRDKERATQNHDKDKENISEKSQGSGVTSSNAHDSGKNNSDTPKSKGQGAGNSSRVSNNNNNKETMERTNQSVSSRGSGTVEAIGNGSIPNMKQSPRNIPKISNTGIGDLDDFGSLPTTSVKVGPVKEKEKKTPDKIRMPLETYSVLSPAKTNALKSPGGPNAGRRGQKKEEGWKEVIRKSKKVTVASSSISRVIGRNGCNINAIREVSGAHIEIDKARSSGDRNITIRGSADATRQAHNLIMALIKDPDKELEQIIPKLKNRVVGTNTLSLSTSVWHNSAMDGAPHTIQSSTTLTTVISTMSASLVTAQKGTAPKMATAVTKAAGSMTLVTTTVSQSVPGRNVTVTSSGSRPQTSTLSSVGVFHAPIGVWNASMAQTSPAPGSGNQMASASTPQSVQARRQLFPGDRQASLPSNMSVANKPATYSSPSMAKTKVVSAATPGVTSREIKDTSSSACSSFARDSVTSSQSVAGSPNRPLQSNVPYPNKEPLPIKASIGSGSLGNKPVTSSQAEFYSPFNNTFSPFAERVLGKKEEGEGKMNFASVAAAGVVPTMASQPTLPQGASASQPGRDLDPSLQAKAPGYKAPGAQRTSSPLVTDPDVAARAPGYRAGPPDVDSCRLQGFKPSTFMGIGEYDMSCLPNDFNHYVMLRAQQKEMLQVPQIPENISPHSASSTPASIQSPHQPVLPATSTFKDEYTTPDQPMTLPKIESNLNPNAPDFTFRLQANQQLQRQLLAAEIFAQQQRQQQQQQQPFNPLGPVTSNACNSLPFHPANLCLQPPFMLGQQNLVDMAGGGGTCQNLADSGHQVGGFGTGGSFHSVASGSLGEGGGSGFSPSNRQFSPMPPNAARSESVASSVGTSSKGESSPVPHVSGESSPLSSSAPSPTDHLPQYMDERLQPGHQHASLRPIGTGRTAKKDRAMQPYGDIADPSSAGPMWGMARNIEMRPDWMVGNPSSMGNNVSRMSHGLPSDMDDNHRSSKPGPSNHLLSGLMHLESSTMLDHPVIEPSLHNPPLLASDSGGTLFASGMPTPSTGPVPMSKVYPPVDGMQSNIGLSGSSGSGVGLPGDSLGNVWTQPPPNAGHVAPNGAETGESNPKSMWESWTMPPNL